MARYPARLGPEACDPHQGLKGGKPVRVARGVDARYLLARGRDPAGRAARQGEGRRRAGPHPDRVRQDRRHHGRPAARGGAVRGAASEGQRDHRGDHGTVEFGKDYKNKQRIFIKPDDESAEPKEYLIPRGKNLAVQHGDRIEKGDFVYDGHPAPHDILAIKGVEELANYLINEIQDVYRLQGVTINDKHIEVIVRQMLQKVEIEDAGETEFLKGEQLDRIDFNEQNPRIREVGQASGNGQAGAARHHQGLAADEELHLGRLVPGDHPRADRCRRQRQGRHARGPQGERDRRASDPGGHGRHAAPPAQGGRQARRADRQGEGEVRRREEGAAPLREDGGALRPPERRRRRTEAAAE